MLGCYCSLHCSDSDLIFGVPSNSNLSALLLSYILLSLSATRVAQFRSFGSLRLVTKHPFHIVTPSPWPLFSAFSSLLLVCGLVLSWSHRSLFLLSIGNLLLALSCLFWWSSVVLESSFIGIHTVRVQYGLRLGMGLFIVSEVFFFLGFFWAYLHCSLSPNVELGSC